MVRYGETLSPGGQACLTGVMDPWELDAAFAAVERADFLPTGSRGQAGTDAPVPIGQGQTNSQPRIVKTMLELLDVRRHLRRRQVERARRGAERAAIHNLHERLHAAEAVHVITDRNPV